MSQNINTRAMFVSVVFFALSVLLGLSFWWSIGFAILGYTVGIDEHNKEQAIKNGDDLSKWPKEKAKKDFQEWLNKH